MINMVIIDVTMVVALSLMGAATALTLFMIFKYVYLSIIDLDKALD